MKFSNLYNLENQKESVLLMPIIFKKNARILYFM